MEWTSSSAQSPQGTAGNSDCEENQDAGTTNGQKAHCQGSATIEAQSDLRQFLKVVRPDWSCPKKSGHNNIRRVLEKLQDIGVVDTWDLVRRVTNNSVNEDLSNAGHSRFSRDTLDKIRKQSSFIRSLEHTQDAYYRQVGLFAPVPQMLSSTNLRHKHIETKKRENESQLKSPSGPRPATTDGGAQASRQEDRPRVPLSSLNAIGLGDHGGVFVSGTLSRASSEGFADMLSTKSSSSSGALYLRNGRPRHGRLKHSQARPVTVCSLPDVRKLQQQGASASYNSEAGAAFSSFPLRGRLDSETSCCNSCGDESDWESVATHRLSKWSKLGDRINNRPWVAKWTNPNSLLRRGEAMLNEQSNMEDRKDLYRVIESEGDESPMRRHVAQRIEKRLREQMERDAGESLDTQQRCLNIRKSLASMQATRRELSEQKRKAQDVLIGPVRHDQWGNADGNVGLSADVFRVAKTHTYEGDFMEH